MWIIQSRDSLLGYRNKLLTIFIFIQKTGLKVKQDLSLVKTQANKNKGMFVALWLPSVLFSVFIEVTEQPFLSIDYILRRCLCLLGNTMVKLSASSSELLELFFTLSLHTSSFTYRLIKQCRTFPKTSKQNLFSLTFIYLNDFDRSSYQN